MITEVSFLISSKEPVFKIAVDILKIPGIKGKREQRGTVQ